MGDSFDFNHHSHRRLNPLTNNWVLCSPHRTQRPWQGKQEDDDTSTQPSYDPSCYLCPRNTRASGGTQNPDYKDTFVFENDFPAVQQNQPDLEVSPSEGILLNKKKRSHASSLWNSYCSLSGRWLVVDHL
jgi:UDPglucose--hexose-1-phosphate uridylyltransferase